eukprot:m51a1_g11201 hypothetical protein (265) ;mRNA; f:19440-20454
METSAAAAAAAAAAGGAAAAAAAAAAVRVPEVGVSEEAVRRRLLATAQRHDTRVADAALLSADVARALARHVARALGAAAYASRYRRATGGRSPGLRAALGPRALVCSDTAERLAEAQQRMRDELRRREDTSSKVTSCHDAEEERAKAAGEAAARQAAAVTPVLTQAMFERLKVLHAKQRAAQAQQGPALLAAEVHELNQLARAYQRQVAQNQAAQRAGAAGAAAAVAAQRACTITAADLMSCPDIVGRRVLDKFAIRRLRKIH